MRIRAFNFWRQTKMATDQNGSGSPSSERNSTTLSYNSILVSRLLGRFFTIITSVLFLVVPLTVMGREGDKDKRITAASVFVVLFSLVVTAALQIPNFQVMTVCAAYAAVLSTFLS
ncbi:hypothetical protein MCOR25_003893 [Pyricularia grisea]|nr:hypothetical protein MCOR25_003893 [Pyricularia grisea]